MSFSEKQKRMIKNMSDKLLQDQIEISAKKRVPLYCNERDDLKAQADYNSLLLQEVERRKFIEQQKAE